jgi:hypothetical protein
VGVAAVAEEALVSGGAMTAAPTRQPARG